MQDIKISSLEASDGFCNPFRFSEPEWESGGEWREKWRSLMRGMSCRTHCRIYCRLVFALFGYVCYARFLFPPSSHVAPLSLGLHGVFAGVVVVRHSCG